MLRPSPNHGTQRLPNDDDDDNQSINTWLEWNGLNLDPGLPLDFGRAWENGIVLMAN